jgi:KipI family sensor histidine kinase inhibitor
MTPKLTEYGERSILIEDFETTPLLISIELEQAFPTASIRSGLSSVVITFPDYEDYFAQVEKVLAGIKTSEQTVSSKVVEIPVTYDGEDLEAVAKATGLSVAEVISNHQAVLWSVKLIGFAPGFPYLVPTSGSSVFDSVGRLETPRTKVPSGAVGIAAGMSCIYPSVMPGGWQLIGRTELVLFDVTNTDKPSLLNIGDQVRFVEVSK